MLWLVIPHDLRQLVKNEQKRHMIRNNQARFGMQRHASGNNQNSAICIPNRHTLNRPWGAYLDKCRYDGKQPDTATCIFQIGTYRTNRVWQILTNTTPENNQARHLCRVKMRRTAGGFSPNIFIVGLKLKLIIPHGLRQLVKNEQKRHMIRNNPARFGLQWHASGNNQNLATCIFPIATHWTNRVWHIWKNADTMGNNRTWQHAYSKPTHIISTVCGIFGHIPLRWETTGHGNMQIPIRHVSNQPCVAYFDKHHARK